MGVIPLTSSEIDSFICVRNGELSSDEILHVIDISRNPQIDHIIYRDGWWTMWDNQGHEFKFKKRNW